MIIVATSGDTGGAVLDGFSKHAGRLNSFSRRRKNALLKTKL